MGNWQDYVNNKYAKKKETEPGGQSGASVQGTAASVRKANQSRLRDIYERYEPIVKSKRELRTQLARDMAIDGIVKSHKITSYHNR